MDLEVKASTDESGSSGSSTPKKTVTLETIESGSDHQNRDGILTKHVFIRRQAMNQVRFLLFFYSKEIVFLTDVRSRKTKLTLVQYLLITDGTCHFFGFLINTCFYRLKENKCENSFSITYFL